MSLRLVQLASRAGRLRRVALVEEPSLICLQDIASIYDLVHRCFDRGGSLSGYVRALAQGERLSYDEVYAGPSDWRLLPPIDVPGMPSKVLVAGTGLTHLGSARERQAMHLAERPLQEAEAAALTDSMRMFQLGVAGGRPAPGKVGVAPEWFYKGDGSVLRAPFAGLEIPPFAEDGGEEAEIAGIYLVDAKGTPVRIGMCHGNEFSDHLFEKKNYLNLAGSKLRACSLGPELVLDAPFENVPGHVCIEREGKTLWRQDVASGEENMAHSLANLEHHHFKFAGHRQPGGVHVHFFGADALSFGSGVRLQHGDTMEIAFEGYGRALRNPVTREPASVVPVIVQAVT